MPSARQLIHCLAPPAHSLLHLCKTPNARIAQRRLRTSVRKDWAVTSAQLLKGTSGTRVFSSNPEALPVESTEDKMKKETKVTEDKVKKETKVTEDKIKMETKFTEDHGEDKRNGTGGSQGENPQDIKDEAPKATPGPVKMAKAKRGGRQIKKGPQTAEEGFKSLALQAKALRICSQLDELYPDPAVPLENRSTYQLLAACMLSARTTDAQVNLCTPALFKAAPDAESMAKLEVPEILELIRRIGLAPTKAKNLQKLSQMIVEKFKGEVPDNFEDLESLPGVGHKTASVVMSQGFGKAAFPVDTHIHRLAERWGLSDGSTVVQTEADLKALFPEESWNALHLQIIYFGREHCPALHHDQSTCPICSWAAPDGPKKGPKKPAKKSTRKGARKTTEAKNEGKQSSAQSRKRAPETRSMAQLRRPKRKI